LNWRLERRPTTRVLAARERPVTYCGAAAGSDVALGDGPVYENSVLILYIWLAQGVIT